LKGNVIPRWVHNIHITEGKVTQLASALEVTDNRTSSLQTTVLSSSAELGAGLKKLHCTKLSHLTISHTNVDRLTISND